MLLSIHFSFAAIFFEFICFIYKFGWTQKTLPLLILVINVLSRNIDVNV